MKIALIHPSPVPFTFGGAESFIAGLYRAIHQYTDHQAEVFKLPSPENHLRALMRSYESFFRFSLEGFDLIITAKYPAWMVEHPRQIVYLCHRLRGLYDTYEGAKDFPPLPAQLKPLEDACRKRPVDSAQVNDIFRWMKLLVKNPQLDVNGSLQAFPGALARHLVQALDDWGFRSERTVKYAAISRTVAERPDYFPADARVEPIHIPPALPHHATGRYDYFLAASRLDHPKRMDLIIEAMRQVRAGVRLKIVGTGPQEEFLKKLAGSDERIEFLGFVSENDLVKLYANSLGVVFTPKDEDLGLITLDAMRSKKPVVTVTDSGGPTEFVEEGVTGFLSQPTPESLAAKLQALVDDPALAQQMGEEACRRVESITWENTVKKLFEGVEVRPRRKARPAKTRRKILVLSTYACHPPRSGGEHRIFHLYKNMARDHDVTLLAMVRNFMPADDRMIAPNFRQICIPKNRAQAERQWDVERQAGFDLYDVMMIDHLWHSPEFVEAFRRLAAQSDAVSFAQPFQFSLISECPPHALVIHDTQNVEFELKRPILESSPASAPLLERVFAVEKRACEESDINFATHEAEADALSQLYGVSRERFIIVPNGVDVDDIPRIDPRLRLKRKEELGLSDFPTFLFIGSWHQPNLEALEFIIDQLARKRPQWVFLVPGTVRDFYRKVHPDAEVPPNVLLFGSVTELQKKALYEAADVALNPMFSGSGTNLKTVDFLASGLPTVTTPMGIRGLDVSDAVYVCRPEQFLEQMEWIVANSQAAERRADTGRQLVEEQYHWGRIADRALESLDRLWARQPHRLWKEKQLTQVEYGPGWFGIEPDGNETFRWTRERALVLLPNPGTDAQVAFEMRGTRVNPLVRVFVGGRPAMEQRVPENGWQEFSIPVQEMPGDDFICVSWEAEPFCYGGQDGRKLGVAVKNIRLERSPAVKNRRGM